MKWNVIFSYSKLYAMVQFLGCLSYAFYTKDALPLTLSIPLSSVVITGKQYFQSKTKQNENI